MQAYWTTRSEEIEFTRRVLHPSPTRAICPPFFFLFTARLQVSLAAVDSIFASLLGIKPGHIPFAPAPGISFNDFCSTLLLLAPKAFPSTTAEGALTFLLENHIAAGIHPTLQELDFLYATPPFFRYFFVTFGQVRRQLSAAAAQLRQGPHAAVRVLCVRRRRRGRVRSPACSFSEKCNILCMYQEITPRTGPSADTMRQAAATPLPHSPHSPGGFASPLAASKTGVGSTLLKGEFRQHAPLVKTMKTNDNRSLEKHVPTTGRFLWARDAVVMFQDLGVIGSQPPLLTVAIFQQLFDKSCKQDPASLYYAPSSRTVFVFVNNLNRYTKGLSFPEFQLLLCK
jgi:hypothetical protein